MMMRELSRGQLIVKVLFHYPEFYWNSALPIDFVGLELEYNTMRIALGMEENDSANNDEANVQLKIFEENGVLAWWIDFTLLSKIVNDMRYLHLTFVTGAVVSLCFDTTEECQLACAAFLK